MIGILNAFGFPGAQEDAEAAAYEVLIRQFAEKIAASANIKIYRVYSGEFPEDVNECSIWLITGSPASVYDDLDWVNRLTNFTGEILRSQGKLIGICFGHQMIAHAAGGKVERSSKGWGLGVREFDVYVPVLQKYLGQKCSLYFSHRDQVVEVPSGAKILGGDAFCPVQIMALGERVISFQGHPEFDYNFMRGRLERIGLGNGIPMTETVSNQSVVSLLREFTEARRP